MLLREPVGTIESHDCGSALPRPATGAPHLLVLAPLCTHSTPVGGGRELEAGRGVSKRCRPLRQSLVSSKRTLFLACA